MITPQYTYDNAGNKVGVFLAIEDWNELSQLPGVEELTPNNNSIPDWHLEKIKAELKNIEEGTTELMEWDIVKRQFNF